MRNSILTVVLAVILCCLASCDIDDDRDLCCERVVMEYRYTLNGEDAFMENISSLQHFLFGGDGGFIREVPPGKCPRTQYLDRLTAGNYTMVTVGNATGITQLETPAAGESIGDFLLGVRDGSGADTDPLYYGICPFALTREDIARQRHFVTYLSNVHCRLKVKVRWQSYPPVMTSKPVYRVTLDGCASGYRLDCRDGYAIGEKRFPVSTACDRRHVRDLALQSRMLFADFTTLRYSDDRIPKLEVLARNDEGEYESLTGSMDLRRAFRVWGFRPQTMECQNYSIIVTIYDDGHVGIRIEGQGGIADWEDGGSFG